MFHCQLCSEEFPDKSEAKEHLRNDHPDKCDELLQEYIEDSVNDAFDNFMEGEED